MLLRRWANSMIISLVQRRQGSVLRLILQKRGNGFGPFHASTRDNPMRAAIYARYSTDLQSASSIEDQVRLCRERAEKENGTVVDIYSDYAISGSSLHNRPGMRALLEEAKKGRFDCVIAEALDRVSRDQEDIAAISKRLRYSDIRVLTLAEGERHEL